MLEQLDCKRYDEGFCFLVDSCDRIPYCPNRIGQGQFQRWYVRYNFFSVSPIMSSFEELTETLRVQLSNDQKRLHYEKEIMIEELWKQESNYLLALPQKEYPIFKELKLTVNKYNEAQIDKAMIHIPRAANYSSIYLILTWDRFKAISPNGEILLEDYRPYMNNKRAIPWITVVKDWIRKPRVVAYSRYQRYLPGRIKDYLMVDDLSLRKDRLKELVNLLVTHDMKRINEEFYGLISDQNGDPYGVNWNLYDSLAPSDDEGDRI